MRPGRKARLGFSCSLRNDSASDLLYHFAAVSRRGKAVNNESHSQMAGLVDTVARGQRIQSSSGISQHLINPSVMLHPVIGKARIEL